MMKNLIAVLLVLVLLNLAFSPPACSSKSDSYNRESSLRGYFSRKFDEFVDKKVVANDTRNPDLSNVLKHKLVDSIRSRFLAKRSLPSRISGQSKRSIHDLSYAGLTHGEVLDLLEKKKSISRLDVDPSEDSSPIATGRLLLRLHNANILLRVKHPGVACKPVAFCPVIYGTDPQHFVQFGFISPQENHCHASDKLVLCVVTPLTSPTTTTTAPTTTTTPVTVPTTVTVPSQGIITGTVPSQIVHPTTGLPFVGQTNPSNFLPYYNNVQVIGPKPIYITYNNVVGPSVSNNFGNAKKKPGIKDDDDKELDYEEVVNENPEVLTRDGKVDVIRHVLTSSDDKTRDEVLNQAVDLIRNATLVNDPIY